MDTPTNVGRNGSGSDAAIFSPPLTPGLSNARGFTLLRDTPQLQASYSSAASSAAPNSNQNGNNNNNNNSCNHQPQVGTRRVGAFASSSSSASATPTAQLQRNIFYAQGVEHAENPLVHYMHVGVWYTRWCDYYQHRSPQPGEILGHEVVWLHNARPRDRFVFMVRDVEGGVPCGSLIDKAREFVYGNAPRYAFDGRRVPESEKMKLVRNKRGVEIIEILHCNVTAVDFSSGLVSTRFALETSEVTCTWFRSEEEARLQFGCSLYVPRISSGSALNLNNNSGGSRTGSQSSSTAPATQQQQPTSITTTTAPNSNANSRSASPSLAPKTTTLGPSTPPLQNQQQSSSSLPIAPPPPMTMPASAVQQQQQQQQTISSTAASTPGATSVFSRDQSMTWPSTANNKSNTGSIVWSTNDPSAEAALSAAEATPTTIADGGAGQSWNSVGSSVQNQNNNRQMMTGTPPIAPFSTTTTRSVSPTPSSAAAAAASASGQNSPAINAAWGSRALKNCSYGNNNSNNNNNASSSSSTSTYNSDQQQQQQQQNQKQSLVGSAGSYYQTGSGTSHYYNDPQNEPITVNSTLVTFFTQDPNFHAIVRELVLPGGSPTNEGLGCHDFTTSVEERQRLLRLVEAGIPSWAIFCSRYGIFYRRSLRVLIVGAINIWPLVALCLGLYDLYSHMPYVHEYIAPLLNLFENSLPFRVFVYIAYFFTYVLYFVQWIASSVRSVLAFWEFMLLPFAPLFALVQPIVNLVVWLFQSGFSLVSMVSQLLFGKVLFGPIAAIFGPLINIFRAAPAATSAASSASSSMPVLFITVVTFWRNVASPIKNAIKSFYDGLVHVGTLIARHEASLRMWYMKKFRTVSSFVQEYYFVFVAAAIVLGVLWYLPAMIGYLLLGDSGTENGNSVQQEVEMMTMSTAAAPVN